MGRNILLIYPDPDEEKECRFGYSLSLLYLASILRQAGDACQLLDLSYEACSADSFRDRVLWADVIIVEFDSFPLKRASNSTSGLELVNAINGLCQVPVIAFGHECVIRQKAVPGAVVTYVTEPESSILATVDAVVRRKQQPPCIAQSGTLQDMDLLPLPARDLLPEPVLYGQTRWRMAHLARSALIETSRGCMNTCRFCQRHGWSSSYRAHSVEYSLLEFEELAKEQYVNVWITDDNFCFNLPRAKSLLRGLAKKGVTRGMSLALSSWTRIDFETLELAHSARVKILSFGIESADSAIMHFYDKRIDLSHTRELIKAADALGQYTVANVIVGAPMESEDTIRSTFDYVLSVPFDEVNVKILNYMPGAPLYSELPAAMQEGARDVFACAENGLCRIPRDELKARCDNFTRFFKAARAPRLSAKLTKCGPPYAVLRMERVMHNGESPLPWARNAARGGGD